MKYLLLVSAFVLGCSKPKVHPEPDCGFVKDINGQRISWNQRVPVYLYLHESFPSEYRQAVIEAMNVWEQSLGREMFVLQEEMLPGEAKPERDGRSVIYWMREWELEKDEEQGRTDLYSRGFEILEADIRINGGSNSFHFYAGNPSSSTDVNLKSLLVHELGHVLGLAHQESPESVMKTHLAPLEDRSQLEARDLENLHCEY